LVLVPWTASRVIVVGRVCDAKGLHVEVIASASKGIIVSNVLISWSIWIEANDA
jgi:hypothetical protein